MKRFSIIIMVIFCIFTFAACSNRTVETREVEATVVKCEKGIFMPHEEYLAEANICLAFEKIAAYEYYKQLANEHGSWQYNVTVLFEGEEYTISRIEAFDVGTILSVAATFTYSGDELVHVSCK